MLAMGLCWWEKRKERCIKQKEQLQLSFKGKRWVGLSRQFKVVPEGWVQALRMTDWGLVVSDKDGEPGTSLVLRIYTPSTLG